MQKIGEIFGDKGFMIQNGDHFVGRKKLLGSSDQMNDDESGILAGITQGKWLMA